MVNLSSTILLLTVVVTVSIVLDQNQSHSLAIESPLIEKEEENADFLAMSDAFERTEFKADLSDLQCKGEECGDVTHALFSIAHRFIEPHVVLYSFHDNGKLQRHVRSDQSEHLPKYDPGNPTILLNATGRSRANPSSSDFYSAYFANNQQQTPSIRQRVATIRNPDPDTYDTSTAALRKSKYNQASLLALADDSYGGGGTYSGPSYEGSSYDSYSGGTSGYGGGSYGGYGGYGGYQCCTQKKDSLLPLLVVGALGLLAFYLYLQSTTTAGRRRRNADGTYSDDVEDEVTLDGSTWLSLIHELWEQDGVVDDPSCAQHTLCRMNYLAMSAPGQAGWAVSMSSMPLSYLLHNRHNGGFTMYMDASLLGRTGANCSSLFSNCPRLH